MGSESYHEPYEILSPSTREMHRAIISLMEELEAIDWYQQRADACEDDHLKEILIHNKNEEIEHAMMTLEWIRRNSKEFDEEMRTYLFTEGPITTIEERKMNGDGGSEDAEGKSAAGTDGSLLVRKTGVRASTY